ncbi:ADP compounds hydrolase NudE [Pantoea sp. Aalb]|uniref:ADP compounds hydrolase NudE n=1 Tax=Pantoea sp. Aalb TaxID=2576762 RepID=UPI001323FE57|nr:ADP compounds hydrolase NudE [Pantoea sp. Aalb]MXP67861.1 ADP compounds hydrolase NudE [Pantoea sp. Aalb]
MKKSLEKPNIINVEVVACSQLFTIEAVDLTFSNGVRRIYERMKPCDHEAVMIVPILGYNLILIQEYAVGLDSYQLTFPKGRIDFGENAFEAADRELKEEVGFGAARIEVLGKLTMAPSYFSHRMTIVVAEGLYERKLQGDEPEPLIIYRWPLDNLLELLNKPDFREARNVSALFMVREWLVSQGRLNY